MRGWGEDRGWRGRDGDGTGRSEGGEEREGLLGS